MKKQYIYIIVFIMLVTLTSCFNIKSPTEAFSKEELRNKYYDDDGKIQDVIVYENSGDVYEGRPLFQSFHFYYTQRDSVLIKIYCGINEANGTIQDTYLKSDEVEEVFCIVELGSKKEIPLQPFSFELLSYKVFYLVNENFDCWVNIENFVAPEKINLIQQNRPQISKLGKIDEAFVVFDENVMGIRSKDVGLLEILIDKVSEDDFYDAGYNGKPNWAFLYEIYIIANGKTHKLGILDYGLVFNGSLYEMDTKPITTVLTRMKADDGDKR